MPKLDYTRFLLGIKLSEEIIFTTVPRKLRSDGKAYMVFEAKLTHKPKFCPHCGIIKEGFNIRVYDYYISNIKWGHSSLVTKLTFVCVSHALNALPVVKHFSLKIVS